MIAANTYQEGSNTNLTIRFTDDLKSLLASLIMRRIVEIFAPCQVPVDIIHSIMRLSNEVFMNVILTQEPHGTTNYIRIEAGWLNNFNNILTQAVQNNCKTESLSAWIYPDIVKRYYPKYPDCR